MCEFVKMVAQVNYIVKPYNVCSSKFLRITFHRHRRRNHHPGHHILCYAISSKHYHMMLVQGWQKFDKVYPPSQVSTTGKHSMASCSCNKTLLLPLLRNIIMFSTTLYEMNTVKIIYISFLFINEYSTFFQ